LKLLLTDNAGLLGRALEHELEHESLRLLQPAEQEVDWSDSQSVVDYVRRVRPHAVINTLGWSESPEAVDKALLPLAASNVAAACVARQIPLIQMSSYQVFGSDNKSVYQESDIPGPLSAVGEAFLAAEKEVAAVHIQHIHLRVSWVIAAQGQNLLTRLLQSLAADEAWKVSSRLRGVPTSVSDVCRVLVALVKQIQCGADNWGVMQYCSADAVTELEFAQQLADILAQQSWAGPEPVLEAIDVLPDQVPVSAVLASHRIRDDFGIQPRSWRPSLMPMVKQWLHANS